MTVGSLIHQVWKEIGSRFRKETASPFVAAPMAMVGLHREESWSVPCESYCVSFGLT